MRFDWHRFDNIYTKLEKKYLLDEFLKLLFTPEEQQIFNQRLRIIEALLEGKQTQRQIATTLKVSISQITRGSNELKRISPELKQHLLDHLKKPSTNTHS